MTIQERSSSPNRLLAKLIMKRNAKPHFAYVLVEGKTDQAVWSKFKSDECELLPADGKDKVMATLRMANFKQPSWRNVAAIVDPDYWLIEQSDELMIPNLLFDDTPDLEIMLITSEALESVVLNTITVDGAHDFCRSLRGESFRLAQQFGYFRLLDFRNRHFNLSFKRVSFAEVIDRRTLQLDEERVTRELVTNSTLTAGDLASHIAELRSERPAELKLCRGRDVRDIVACLIEFNDELSASVKIKTRSNELARALRMAFEFAHFVMTALYRRIRDWEARHAPFRIIRDYPTERTPA